jgi:phage anti-repressor protein
MLTILHTTVGNETNSVSARELHKRLEIKTDFSDWIKYQIKRGAFEENLDFTVVWSDPRNKVAFISETEMLKQFTTSQKAVASGYQSDYILTLDTAKEIAMMSGTNKGKSVRNYFIQVERDHKVLLAQHRSLLLAQAEERTQQIKDACNSGSAKANTVIQELETNNKELETNNKELTSNNKKLETTNKELQEKLDTAVNKRVLQEYNGYKSISALYEELEIVSPTLREFFNIFRKYNYIRTVPCTRNELATEGIGAIDSKNNPRFTYTEVMRLLDQAKQELEYSKAKQLRHLSEDQANSL